MSFSIRYKIVFRVARRMALGFFSWLARCNVLRLVLKGPFIFDCDLFVGVFVQDSSVSCARAAAILSKQRETTEVQPV